MAIQCVVQDQRQLQSSKPWSSVGTEEKVKRQFLQRQKVDCFSIWKWVISRKILLDPISLPIGDRRHSPGTLFIFCIINTHVFSILS